MAFYCRLLNFEVPMLPKRLLLSDLAHMEYSEMSDLMKRFVPWQNHCNRYLSIGGFPERVLSDDDFYAQRMLIYQSR